MYVCIIIIGNDNFLVDYELIGYFYFLFFYFLP